MRLISLIVALAAAAATAVAAPKPKVPAGLDPGGVTVAVIGVGVDYRSPNIARSLARDGEGEIVGWDFVDNDRRPFAASAAGYEGTGLVEKLSEIRWLRLVPLRITPESQPALATATGYAARSGARIVILDPIVASPATFAVIAAATARFPQVAFVAALPRAFSVTAIDDVLLIGSGAGSDIAVEEGTTVAATMARLLHELPSCVAAGSPIVAHPKLRRVIASLENSPIALHGSKGAAPCSIRIALP